MLLYFLYICSYLVYLCTFIILCYIFYIFSYVCTYIIHAIFSISLVIYVRTLFSAIFPMAKEAWIGIHLNACVFYVCRGDMANELCIRFPSSDAKRFHFGGYVVEVVLILHRHYSCILYSFCFCTQHSENNFFLKGKYHGLAADIKTWMSVYLQYEVLWN